MANIIENIVDLLLKEDITINEILGTGLTGGTFERVRGRKGASGEERREHAIKGAILKHGLEKGELTSKGLTRVSIGPKDREIDFSNPSAREQSHKGYKDFMKIFSPGSGMVNRDSIHDFVWHKTKEAADANEREHTAAIGNTGAGQLTAHFSSGELSRNRITPTAIKIPRHLVKSIHVLHSIPDSEHENLGLTGSTKIGRNVTAPAEIIGKRKNQLDQKAGSTFYNQGKIAGSSRKYRVIKTGNVPHVATNLQVVAAAHGMDPHKVAHHITTKGALNRRATHEQRVARYKGLLDELLDAATVSSQEHEEYRAKNGGKSMTQDHKVNTIRKKLQGVASKHGYSDPHHFYRMSRLDAHAYHGDRNGHPINVFSN